MKPIYTNITPNGVIIIIVCNDELYIYMLKLK